MNIDSHPIHRKIYELCLEIEALPASEQATKVVVLATALHEEAEQLRNQLAASNQLISELTSALKNWINYFQADVPKTAESSQEQGDAFTQYWFETEQALTHATACLKERKE